MVPQMWAAQDGVEGCLLQTGKSRKETRLHNRKWNVLLKGTHSNLGDGSRRAG